MWAGVCGRVVRVGACGGALCVWVRVRSHLGVLAEMSRQLPVGVHTRVCLWHVGRVRVGALCVRWARCACGCMWARYCEQVGMGPP